MLALGEMGLEYDYFYSLTPRVFNNVMTGYMKKKQRREELFLMGVRKLGFFFLKPYVKKGHDFKETDLFILPSESEKIEEEKTDLEKVVEQVEQNKKFWEKVDKRNVSKCSAS